MHSCNFSAGNLSLAEIVFCSPNHAMFYLILSASGPPRPSIFPPGMKSSQLIFLLNKKSAFTSYYCYLAVRTTRPVCVHAQKLCAATTGIDPSKIHNVK